MVKKETPNRSRAVSQGNVGYIVVEVNVTASGVTLMVA